MIYIILTVLNIISFCLFGTDKMFAKKRLRRIKEATLIYSALLGGGIGAILGMVVFNHKTSKIKFRLFVPLAAILTTSLIFYKGNIVTLLLSFIN